MTGGGTGEVDGGTGCEYTSWPLPMAANCRFALAVHLLPPQTCAPGALGDAVAQRAAEPVGVWYCLSQEPHSAGPDAGSPVARSRDFV